MQTITDADLARQTRRILDAVMCHGETVVVERDRTPVARIVPAPPAMTAAQALAGLATTLTPRQADAWLAESRFEFADDMRDPWA